jgi:hypothetical protein
MKRKICLIILSLLLTSCAPIYIPNNINTPLLSRKNEATINLAAGQNGADCQLSYAVSDNIGVLLNGSYLLSDKKGNSGNNDTYQQKQNYIEAAVGSFGEITENAVVETYLGIGYGKSASSDSYLFDDSKKIYGEGEFYKIFLQTDIGMKGKFFEGGIALRSAYIKFDKISYESNYPADKKFDSIFLEPAVFMRVGSPNFKIQTQVGFSSKLSRKDFLMYEPLILSIGFIIRLNTTF